MYLEINLAMGTGSGAFLLIESKASSHDSDARDSCIKLIKLNRKIHGHTAILNEANPRATGICCFVWMEISHKSTS